jgi:hypothetical protein
VDFFYLSLSCCGFLAVCLVNGLVPVDFLEWISF